MTAASVIAVNTDSNIPELITDLELEIRKENQVLEKSETLLLCVRKKVKIR